MIARIPDNVTDDEAATVPTALNTPQVGLYDSDGFGFPSPFDEGGAIFGKGKSILVIGGSSIIGLGGNFPIGVPNLH